MDTNDTGINKFLVPISIILAGLIIGGAVYFGSGKAPTAGTTGHNGSGQTATVNIRDVKTDGSPFIGNANAPVTIAYWSDFQCPFCKQFDETTLRDLVAKYVDTGKARIVFMDFQFLGPDSSQDALFARAVWDLYPDKYQAWREAWYADQPQENSLSSAENEKQLEKVATSVPGIDVAKVVAQVTAKKSAYQTAIDADRAQGQTFGVNATPSFVIGTNLIVGAQPLPAFESDLDALLK